MLAILSNAVVTLSHYTPLVVVLLAGAEGWHVFATNAPVAVVAALLATLVEGVAA